MKFGITAEAAQLFETELGTAILGARGLAKGWHVDADSQAARKTLKNIDRSTLGGLVKEAQKHIRLDAELVDKFMSALDSRNRLMHGFYERHNFTIDADEGRDEMMADLEKLTVMALAMLLGPPGIRVFLVELGRFSVDNNP